MAKSFESFISEPNISPKLVMSVVNQAGSWRAFVKASEYVQQTGVRYAVYNLDDKEFCKAFVSSNLADIIKILKDEHMFFDLRDDNFFYDVSKYIIEYISRKYSKNWAKVGK